jgi:hypothetical protein
MCCCREGVKKLLASGTTLRLNFAAFDVGVVYSPKNPKTLQHARRRVAQVDRHARFKQLLVSGGRLPHAWLKRECSGGEGEPATGVQRALFLEKQPPENSFEKLNFVVPFRSGEDISISGRRRLDTEHKARSCNERTQSGHPSRSAGNACSFNSTSKLIDEGPTSWGHGGGGGQSHEEVLFSTLDLVSMWPGRPLVLASARAEHFMEWFASQRICGDFDPVLCLISGTFFRESCKPGAVGEPGPSAGMSEQHVGSPHRVTGKDTRGLLQTLECEAKKINKTERPLHSEGGKLDADASSARHGPRSFPCTDAVSSAHTRIMRTPSGIKTLYHQHSTIDMHLCSEDELLAGHASSGQERGESLDLNIVRLRMEEDSSEQHSQSDPGALSNSMDVVVVRPDGHVAWFGSARHALGLLAQGLKVEHLLF